MFMENVSVYLLGPAILGSDSWGNAYSQDAESLSYQGQPCW